VRFGAGIVPHRHRFDPETGKAMKKLFALLSLVLMVGLATEASAQARTITGQVTSAETSQPLAGVSVLVKGTSLATRTDAQGRYSVNVPASASTLTFSSLEYGTRDVAITGTTVDVQLSRQVVALEGLVVTGLGVEREKSQLGTAQQQVSSEALNATRSHNVMSQLQGKVSGVAITNSGTPGGSVNINIRGSNSISGNNQPLFVVDGTPVSNANRGGGIVEGYDFGNAISDLNPEDIESITVLKGPNAAALYGSRAANGVILVTTKRGRLGGIQTSASLTYDWARPSILPDFQDQYGQGIAGEFSYVNGAGGGLNDYADQSYGPKLDGRLIDQYNGKQRPWIAHPNNVRDFFETGHTLTTHVAVSGGTENATGRLSLGVDNTDGYIPNNSFQKLSALLSAGLDVNSKLSTRGSLEYIRDNGRNRPGTGYSGSTLEQFFWFGRQVNIDDLRNYKQGGAVNNGPANREYNWNYNFHNNPFWLQYENPVRDTRDRITITGSADYQLNDWIRATLRSGSDIYRLNIDQNFADQNLNFTDVSFAGGFVFINDYNNENNTDFIVTADRNLTDRIAANAMVGAGARREYYSTMRQATQGISVPGIYNVSNAAIAPTLGQLVERRAVNSGYGSLSFTWDGWWTVEGTGRNDWSSTLPAGGNSYFYPSVNTSIVLTDAIPGFQSDFLSYAKIRGSIARVGNDARPYQLLTTFTGNSNKFDGLPQFSLGNTLANSELKPEITTSNEVGLELGLFNGRATIDATYYDKVTRNQIFNVPISSTSGFASKAVNAGAVQNKGWEALLSVTPVELDNGLRWTSTINWAKNNSEITDLYPGVNTIILGDVTGRASIFGDVQLQARKDRPYGAIFGAEFARDDAGNILTSEGLPFAADTFSYLGTVQPDWTGGWMNEIAFGAFQLNVLFDAKHGGKLYSYTNLVGETSGVLEQTLRGREVDWNDPGIVVKGIDVDTGEPNTVNRTSEEYFQILFGIAEPYVYDAGYVKLRELRLGFEVPAKWTNRLGTSGLNIALTGRNLVTWKNVPNIDPEFAYASNNYQGIEYAIVSNPRSIGLSVQVRP
jgi:TonB-linked SusC/RagA family outer membrane protein